MGEKLSIEQPSSIEKDSAHMQRIADTLADVGVIHTVEDSFGSFSQRNKERIQVQLASFYAQTGDRKRAIAIVESITDPDRRKKALSGVINASSEAGQTEEIIQMTQSTKDDNIRSELLTLISVPAAQHGKVEEIKKIAESLPNSFSDRDIGLLTVATAAAQAGNIDYALNIAESLPSSTDEPIGKIGIGKPFPAKLPLLGSREEAMSRIATVLARTGEIDRAIDLIKTIPQTNERWRSEAVVGVAGPAVQTGKFEELLTLIEPKSVPDVISAEIAKEVAQVGDTERAITMLKSMRDERYRRETIKAIATHATHADTFEELLPEVQKLRDSSLRNEALVALVGEIARIGEFKQAVEITTSLLDTHWRPEGLKKIAASVAQVEQWDELISTAQALPNILLRNRGLLKIAGELAQKNKLDRAIEITDSILHQKYPLIRAGDHGSSNVFVDSVLREGCAEVIKRLAVPTVREGKVKKLITMTQLIKDELHRNEALIAISAALSETGNIEEAMTIAQTIVEEETHAQALEEIIKTISIRESRERGHSLLSAINRDELMRIITLTADKPFIVRGMMEQFPSLREDINTAVEKAKNQLS